MSDPQWFKWNGAAMMPTQPDLARKQFIVDGKYLLETHHERAYRRHRAYFAALHEAWGSIATDDFPTSEHLRKFALIKTGWRQERVLACDSKERAERTAAFIRPLDDYAIVTTDAALVRVWTARSQSYKAMGRDDFNRSMDDVLNYVAGLIGISREVLLAQGELA
jgi:hypothetical protein